MKKAVIGLIAAFIALGAWTAQAEKAWPSVVGTWKGTFSMVSPADGYGSVTIKLVIQNQNGALFRGYFKREGAAETHYVSGSLQNSLVVSGGYDIALAARDEHGSSSLMDAVLTTTSSPWKMTRCVFRVFHDDPAPQGTTTARGTLTLR